MKKLLSTILLLSSLNCFSQIVFKKGYFINNENEKIDCLIKNKDWKDNPSEFEYKFTAESEPQIATIEGVSEFGMYNFSKYSRHNVYIDRSSIIMGQLSNVRKPELKEEVLLLKVLVEGEASVYSYVDGNLQRFFYLRDADLGVEPLIYKKYLDGSNNVVENAEYKQQLWNNLKCESIQRSSFKNLDYDRGDLVRFF